MGGVSTGHRSRIRNAALTVVILIVGYVLPFIVEHLSMPPRGISETLLFLLGHTYFHFYLLCVALTVAVMGVAWYYLEAPLISNYALAGIGYGLVTGITFSAAYIVLGTQVYSFAMSEIYVAILLGIGIVVGTIAGVLRHYTIGYLP